MTLSFLLVLASFYPVGELNLADRPPSRLVALNDGDETLPTALLEKRLKQLYDTLEELLPKLKNSGSSPQARKLRKRILQTEKALEERRQGKGPSPDNDPTIAHLEQTLAKLNEALVETATKLKHPESSPVVKRLRDRIRRTEEALEERRQYLEPRQGVMPLPLVEPDSRFVFL